MADTTKPESKKGLHDSMESLHRALDFIRILEKENRGQPPARRLQVLFQQPPPDDVLLQTIYETPFVRGDIVMAGRKTREKFPLTQQYPIHFKKTYLEKMAGWESPTALEHRQTEMVWQHFEECGEPGRVPKGLGNTPETFRSELIQAKTLGSLSPVHNCNDPEELARQIAAIRGNGMNIKQLWDGAEALREAMSTMHNGGMLHKDAHRENLMVSFDKAGTPTPHIIDFETLEEDARFGTNEWLRATWEDCRHLIEEATLIRMCAAPGEIPIEDTRLTKEVKHLASSSPKILSVRRILATLKEIAPSNLGKQTPEVDLPS
jgi:hypothetical protein